MSNILCIDTSTKVCSVAVFEDSHLIASQAYHLQKSHSSLLPVIISQLLQNAEIDKSDLNAIAVSQGPGSYTGLRIGTATAKGLAFALDLPLIGIDSLDSMTEQVIHFLPENSYICPMIDARRMEVFCKLLMGNTLIKESAPLIIDEQTFSDLEKTGLYIWGWCG